MSEKKSDNQQMIDASQKLINDVESQKAAEADLKAQEERIKQVQSDVNAITLADKVSRSELAEIVKAQEKKLDDMRILLKTAKAQGKAHIVEENESNETQMVKMYGKDSKIGRLFAKK